MKHLLLSFLVLCSMPIGAQSVLYGHVIDRTTKEPLAFANIIFNNDKQMAVTSDIDGRFSLPEGTIDRLQCSHLGYRTINIEMPKDKTLLLQLEHDSNLLHEVLVDGESRARQIIRKVMSNKARNNPENLASFQYKCYNKVSFDFLYNKNKRDSLLISQKIGNSRLLFMESVTRRKFRKPALDEETILATRVSGFERPDFAVLATDLQPFSFYHDDIPLFNVHYLNPIANGSLYKYDFTLQEERILSNDTLFVVSFQPKPQKNFDGLKGTLYINSRQYAIQNVTAEPEHKGKINIKIQQQYQLLEDRYWFPEQLNYTVTIEGYPKPSIGLYSEGKSYLKDVRINPPLLKREFTKRSVHLDEQAMTKDNRIWDLERAVPLSAVELQTYRTIDSLGKELNFDRYLRLTEKLIQGRLPLGALDMDLSKTLVYNKFEGFRLGTGLLTNDWFSRRFTLGVFAGYGLKDRDWKFGGQAGYKWLGGSAGFGYQQNLVETGGYGLKNYRANVYDLRQFIGYRYDKISEYECHITFDKWRYFTFGLKAAHTNIVPQYLYRFEGRSGTFNQYTTSTLGLYARYAFGEKWISSFGSTFSEASVYPVVQFLYKGGFKSVLGSDFNFARIELSVAQSFYSRNLGTTKYQFNAGFIDGDLPAGQLFTGEGAYDTDMLIAVKNTFQTMRPYEFLSNRFAHAFISHNFGVLLFRTPYFSPDVSLLHNMGWGNLSNTEQHVGIRFQTQQHLFLESGLKLDNILKINFRNLGYLGLGAAGFYRYGAYAFDRPDDNIAVKIALAFSIR